MGKREPLPFPSLVDRPEECLGCGYSLDGIPAPGVCPECGLGFDDGVTVLMIAGMAKSSGGPIWRKVAWICIGVFAFLYSQLWVLLVSSIPLMGLVGFMGLVAATAGMALTGNQKKRGTEMFAMTREGFSRWTVGADTSSRVFVRWDGIKPAGIIRRVSSVWASIKIVDFDSAGKRYNMLDGGFRCPAEDLGLIDKVLNQLLQNESIEDIQDDDRFECSVLNVGRWDNEA